MSDPLGKRALFSVAEAPRANGPREVHRPPPQMPITKESLFSASEGARRQHQSGDGHSGEPPAGGHA